MILASFITPLIFLIGVVILTTLSRSLQMLGRLLIKQEFKRRPHYYFCYLLTKRFFSHGKWESLFYLISFTKQLLRLLFATTCFFYVLTLLFPVEMETAAAPFSIHTAHIILAIIFVIVLGLFFEFISRYIASMIPLFLLRAITPVASFFLLLFFPITFCFLKLHRLLFYQKHTASMGSKVKDKILELVHESELSTLLDPIDRRLIISLASFRDRIVREIMVPRIDIFCLSVNQTVHEAAQKFISEGYSRIPVYKSNMDHIEGVLLYKDVMEYYFRSIDKKENSPLDTPLEKLVKPVLYTPETKKISQLLQEIRHQQTHLAIVVDEYGGTEGIVTIEDILEELVGEIADEYDKVEEEKLYAPYPAGGWIVDAKMSIIDIEKELGVLIPPSPEYDTLGGYIFHRAGTIPEKGWKIHNDYFDLEVLSSSERSIEKIILIPPGEH